MADEVKNPYAIERAEISDDAMNPDMAMAEKMLTALFGDAPLFLMVARPTDDHNSNVQTFCSGPIDIMGELLQVVGADLVKRHR